MKSDDTDSDLGVMTAEEACYLLGRAASGKLEMSHELIDQAERLGAVISIGHRHEIWLVEQRSMRAPVGGFGFTSRACAWSFWMGLDDVDNLFELRHVVDPRRESEMIAKRLPEVVRPLGLDGGPKLKLLIGGMNDEPGGASVSPTDRS